MSLKVIVVALLVATSAFVADAATYTYSPKAKANNRGKHVSSKITTTGNGLPDCAPGTAQYSGFVTVNSTVSKKYFYWAFGPKSNRTDAPVILWMTGGPGCSSALAALIENGPCHLNTTTSEIYDNPYGWNNDAFLIYIDQPAGVGFSTSDAAGYDTNEDEVSEDMYWFLQDFLYDAHPEFRAKNNEFFVFGESYGGHYAPATAHKIYERNAQSNPKFKNINLSGLGVGNGLTNPYIQYQYYNYTGYNWCIEKLGEPCVSEFSYDLMTAALPACLALIKSCDDDPAGMGCMEARATCNAALLLPYTLTGRNTYDIRKMCEGDLCYDLGAVGTFMNRGDVQDAFGINPHQTWSSCNMLVNLEFMSDWFAGFESYVADMLDGTGGGKPLRVLIYVGEMDFICNLAGNKAWTLAMDWAQRPQYNAAPDVPYFLPNGTQPVAKVRHVEGSTGKMHFSFAQIFNAGHMVPMDQPEVIADVLGRFVNNKGWN